MESPSLPPDFREFLRSLNSNGVEYLLVGGYAVGYHGYPRATIDMDIWVAVTPLNAQKVTSALREFGFDTPDLSAELFLYPERIVRMGVPPLRIEVITSASGVRFEECYPRRIHTQMDGVDVDIISADDLKTNKRAAARHKDLNDLENLPH